MDIKDVRSLKALLAALRAEGVVRFKSGDLDIVMGDGVASVPVVGGASDTQSTSAAATPTGPYAEMAAELGLKWNDEGAQS